MRTLLFALALGCSSAEAQDLEPEDYYHFMKAEDYFSFLPPPGKIGQQTTADTAFKLYTGGPGNAASDIPNVTLQRAQRLLALADRFSPIMHRTNYSVPRDVEDMLAFEYDTSTKSLGCDGQAQLHIDVWKTTSAAPTLDLRRSRTIKLGLVQYPPVCRRLPEEVPPSPSFQSDTALLNLLGAIGPKGRPADARPRVRETSDTSLYFNLAGSSRRSWRNSYKAIERMPAKAYVHPFIYRYDSAHYANRSYEFVLQYWFFYPFNDGINNHEGDWEHINVSIAPRWRMKDSIGEGRLLSANDIGLILGDSITDGSLLGTTPAAEDSVLQSLVISAVDYYFHHAVVTLDYKPSYESSRAQESEEDVVYNRELAERFGMVRTGGDVRSTRPYRRRLTLAIAERRELLGNLETHPVGYIAGKSVSVLQLGWAPGATNQNSHGSYPFPGVWRDVGPFGATEKMPGHFGDPRENTTKTFEPHRWEESVQSKNFVTFSARAGTLILLPNWEQIEEAVYRPAHTEDQRRVRRRWSWLVLPIRWGYPATASPGAELVKGYDVGHAAPLGPAFSPGWNTVGAGAGFARYQLFPTTKGIQRRPWDNISNSLGVLNIVPVAATVLPVLNLGTAFLLTYVTDREPVYQPFHPSFRSAEVTYVYPFTFGGAGLARNLPSKHVVQASLRPPPAPLQQEPDFFRRTNVQFARVGYTIHWGSKWGSETLYSHSKGILGYVARRVDGSFFRVEGDVSEHELLGAFRFGTRFPFQDNGQIVLRAGYGWTWYHLTNPRVFTGGQSAIPIGNDVPAGRSPLGVVPNTVLFGVAVESATSLGFVSEALQRLKIGLRTAGTWYSTGGVGGRTDFEVGGFFGF